MKVQLKKVIKHLIVVLVLGIFTGCGLSNTKKIDDTLAGVQAIQGTLHDATSTAKANSDALAKLADNQFFLEQQLAEIRDNLAEHEPEDTEPASDTMPAKKATTPTASSGGEKMLLGRVEWVWLPEQKRHFAAQIDTALDFSIIYADDIQRFERNGKKWLRFVIERNAYLTVVEARSTRQQKTSYLGSARVVGGAVVSLPLQLNGFSDVIEFMVVQKKKSYPQLVLGKNFLTDVAVVDVSQKYIVAKRADFVKIEDQHIKKNSAKAESTSRK